MYLLLDDDNVVRCMASEKCNLHKDKLTAGLRMIEATYEGIVGDKYFPEEKRWEKHPENYPGPSKKDINEAKINAKIREMAIRELQTEGELPQNYETIGRN